MTQTISVIAIGVTAGSLKNTLPQQISNAVFNAADMAAILNRTCQTSNQLTLLIDPS